MLANEPLEQAPACAHGAGEDRCDPEAPSEADVRTAADVIIKGLEAWKTGNAVPIGDVDPIVDMMRQAERIGRQPAAPGATLACYIAAEIVTLARTVPEGLRAQGRIRNHTLTPHRQVREGIVSVIRAWAGVAEAEDVRRIQDLHAAASEESSEGWALSRVPARPGDRYRYLMSRIADLAWYLATQLRREAAVR